MNIEKYCNNRGRDFTRIIVLLIILSGLFCACKSPIKLAQGTVSSEEMIVRSHMLLGNVKILANDYYQYANRRESLVPYIMCRDASGMTYNQVLSALDEMVYGDSILWNYYNVIRTELETKELESQFNNSLKEIVDYCKKYQSSRTPWLSTFLDEAIRSNVKYFSYVELKNSLGDLKGTTIDEDVRIAIANYKKSNKSHIEKGLNKYLEREKQIVDYYEYAISLFVYSSVFKSYPDIMTDIFSSDMPRDYGACEARVKKAIEKNFDQVKVNATVQRMVEEMIATINLSRQQIISSLVVDGSSSKCKMVSSKGLKYNNIILSYNMDPIYEISKIDNERKNLGRSLIGLIPVVGFLCDVADADSQGKKERPHIERFVKDFGMRIKPECDRYINNISAQIRKSVTSSQPQFIKEYYNAY